MFHYLRDMEDGRYSFNGLLQRHGYEYQWQMLEREFYAQMKMQRHGDRDNAAMRDMWFNAGTAHDMAVDYIEKLKAYVKDNLTYRKNRNGEIKFKHTCKGNAYVRLGKENIFVSDLNKKVYLPLFQLAEAMLLKSSAEDLYKLVHKFNKTRKHLAARTKQSRAFIDAYKGSGAYFTMRNLIMFHGARFAGSKYASEALSLRYLDALAADCIKEEEQWRMLGILKELIRDSGISVRGKIDEWKKD